MHHYSHVEALPADRIRSWFTEAEQSRLAHRARTDSRTAQTTRREAGPKKKLRLGVPRLSATGRTDDTPSIRRKGRAS